MSLTENEANKLKAIQQSLVKLKPRFEVCFPKNSRLDANRLLAIVSAEMRRTPKILDCDRESIESAVSLAARMMLEPDYQLGYFYLIPYGKTLQVIIGYKGLLELALRSPYVKSLYAQEVYDGDYFEILLGTEKHIRHVPALTNRGNLIGVYAIVEMTDGTKEIEFMNRQEIDTIRGRSKTASAGPWVTDYGAMARKTVLRRITKYIPRAIDAHQAIAIDESVERGEKIEDLVDVEGEIVDTETGEVMVEAKEPAKAAPTGTDLMDKLNRLKEKANGG